MTRGAHRIAILRFVQDIPLAAGRPELSSWSPGFKIDLHLLAAIPMLILWGMKDFVFDHHFLEEWERRFPAAEVHRFALAGHYLFEDEVESTRAPRAAVSRGPAKHPGVRRLSPPSLVTEPANIAAFLVAMAARKAVTPRRSSLPRGGIERAAFATRI